MAADQIQHAIPFDIEKPVPILLWEPLEFIGSIMAIGFGLVLDLIFVGIIAAALVLWGSLRLKRGAKRGAMQHTFWALGLQLDPGLRELFPPSWQNDFVD